MLLTNLHVLPQLLMAPQLPSDTQVEFLTTGSTKLHILLCSRTPNTNVPEGSQLLLVGAWKHARPVTGFVGTSAGRPCFSPHPSDFETDLCFDLAHIRATFCNLSLSLHNGDSRIHGRFLGWRCA